MLQARYKKIAYAPKKKVPAYRKVRRQSQLAAVRQLSNIRTAGFSNVEFKFLDTEKTTTAMAATGTVLNDTICAIPQGAGESSRLGRKCTVTKVDIRGHFKIASNNGVTTGSTIRFIVYLDKQTNAAAALVSDLLVDPGSGLSTQSFRNLQNKDRFRVLFDEYCDLNPQAATITSGDVIATQEIIKPFYFSKKVNIPLEFKSSTPSVADLSSNNIGIMALSEGSHVTTAYVARIRFTDN